MARVSARQVPGFAWRTGSFQRTTSYRLVVKHAWQTDYLATPPYCFLGLIPDLSTACIALFVTLWVWRMGSVNDSMKDVGSDRYLATTAYRL